MPSAGQVSNELERCVIELLEAQPNAIVPLSDLQAALDARLAARAPGPASLIAGIQRRPDLFVVLAHNERIPGADAWPRDVRERYNAELSGAGLCAETHLALEHSAAGTRSQSRDADVLGVLQYSVLQLWRSREKERAPVLDNAVTLFDTVRTALRSEADTK
jgi:hypothetical protein